MTARGRALRPSYRRALRWIVENDDTEWLSDEGGDVTLSVTAALVADLFGLTDEKVDKDLRRELKKWKMKKELPTA